jgi:hypothetical protein
MNGDYVSPRLGHACAAQVKSKLCVSSTKDHEVFIMIQPLKSDGRRRREPLGVDFALFDLAWPRLQ